MTDTMVTDGETTNGVTTGHAAQFIVPRGYTKLDMGPKAPAGK